MDLTLRSPALALRDLSLEQIRLLAYNHDEWTSADAAGFDEHLSARVLDVLREADADALSAAAQQLLMLVRPSARPALDALDRPYAARWRALADLVATRAAQVRAAAPDVVRQRKHAQAVLDALEGGAMKQVVLAKAVGLDPSALSRLLAVMEDGGLVQRTQRGNEKLVSAVDAPKRARTGGKAAQPGTFAAFAAGRRAGSKRPAAASTASPSSDGAASPGAGALALAGSKDR
jgi:DNA-binding transcriptional ArsR family regulator